jgi:nitrous oxidase accessory protein
MSRKIGIINFFLTIIFLNAKQIIVSKTEGFQSIQAAINYATEGDTIRIKKGRYLEHDILINKALVLIGENFPIIDGENKHQILMIKADNVTINSIRFENSGLSFIEDQAAIKVKESKGVKLINNEFNNNFFAIYFGKI